MLWPALSIGCNSLTCYCKRVSERSCNIRSFIVTWTKMSWKLNPRHHSIDDDIVIRLFILAGRTPSTLRIQWRQSADARRHHVRGIAECKRSACTSRLRPGKKLQMFLCIRIRADSSGRMQDQLKISNTRCIDTVERTFEDSSRYPFLEQNTACLITLKDPLIWMYSHITIIVMLFANVIFS